MRLNELSDQMISLYAFHMEHRRQLANAGYSTSEAFWLNFACLPFLPWDDKSENEVGLTQLLKLYLEIYKDNVDRNLKPQNEQAFVSLLKERFDMVRQIISKADPSQLRLELGRFILPGESDVVKRKEAALIVLNTTVEWEKQRPQDSIPCKLVEDI